MKQRALVIFFISLILLTLSGALVAHAAGTSQPATNVPAVYKCTSNLDFGCYLLKAILEGLNSLSTLLLTAIESLFQYMVSLNSSGFIWGTPGVAIGWGVARDVANLFFIIILIIAALATIFDLQTFNIKSILPRLILIALLINFSLVIGRFIIERSNELGMLFLNRAAEAGQARGAAGEASLTSALDNIIGRKTEGVEAELRGQNLKDPTTGSEANDKEKLIAIGQSRDSDLELPEYEFSGSDPTPPAGSLSCVDEFSCTNTAPTKTANLALCGWDAQKNLAQATPQDRIAWSSLACDKWRKNVELILRGPAASDTEKIFLGILVKIIVYPIAIFVFLAGAFLMLSRLLSLMFILILAPLAFLSHLIPTQDHWSEWWKKLFSYSFFFPAFTFCLMISFIILTNAQFAQATAGQLFITYIIGIAFFIASLMVAQKMSIAGSGAVMSTWNKATGAVKGYAKTKGQNAALRVAGTASRELFLNTPIAAALGRVPILRGITRPFEALADKDKKLADKREAGRVERLQRAADVGGAYAVGRLRGERQDIKDEFYDKAKPGQVKKVFDGMSAADAKREIDAIRDPKKKEKAISGIKDLNKKVYASTNIGQGTNNVSPEQMQNWAALSPDQQARFRQAIYQTVANMTNEDQRGVSADTMRRPEVQAALPALLSDANTARNLGNTTEKVEVINEITKQIGGVPPNAELSDRVPPPVDAEIEIKNEADVDLATANEIRAQIQTVLSTVRGLKNQKERMAGWLGQRHISTGLTANPWSLSSVTHAPGSAEWKKAYKEFFEEKAADLIEKSTETHMDRAVKAMEGDARYEPYRNMLVSNPNLRIGIANKAPLSNRGAAFVAAGAPGGPTPP